MTKSFKTPGDFREWLAKNQDMEEGLWVRLYKAGSGVKSITYAEALDEALCYGWIDGRKNGFDEESWLQKFTPRRARSIAKKFFETLNRTNLYSIAWRLQTAKKAETREKRIEIIVKMLEQQRKFH